MYLTEEDAREKWCPFARVASSETEAASANRGLPGDGRGPVGCIASECMAWRTKTKPVLIERATGRFVRYSYPGDSYSSDKYMVDQVADHSKGYCGLAGKPEG
jgi:hypothetical protein